jgi:membrane protease YdiL (CAAX protease family)
MAIGTTYLSRNQASFCYLPVGFVQGWGAGVTEEYAFRNWLMPLLDYKYGQRKGLVISSLTFGAYHIQNYFKADKPELKKTAIAQVFTTSLAGLAYGWDVQRRNYDIGPSVAAHAWFDMIVMVGSFLINPENNYIGVNLKLKL